MQTFQFFDASVDLANLIGCLGLDVEGEGNMSARRRGADGVLKLVGIGELGADGVKHTNLEVVVGDSDGLDLIGAWEGVE